jgi:hypothetical protein
MVRICAQALFRRTDLPCPCLPIRVLTQATICDSLSSTLVPHVRHCIKTLPSSFRKGPSIFQVTSPSPANVAISDLEYPDSAFTGQPFEITIKATNFGRAAKQGYFSLSFPDGTDDLKAMSAIDTKVGHRGDR